MKTILYNTDNQELTHHAKTGYYLVDGVRPTLPNNVIELEWITSQVEASTTEVVESGQPSVDLENGFYYPITYTVRNKTAAEIASEEWKYIDFRIKLIIDEDVAKSSVGVFHFMRFEKDGNPVEYDAVNKKWYVWINAIDLSYQSDYNALIQSGELTLENRPLILD